jgi:hypothetical protein
MSSEDTSGAESSTETGAGGGEPGPDEAFCTSCGSIIKEQAEICPDCGVRQQAGGNAPQGGGAPAGGAPAGGAPAGGQTSDARIRNLQKIAGKDKSTVMLVSFLLTPAGYVMVDKLALAIVNLLTFNYFFLGFIIVPFHTKSIIENARGELEAEGYSW